MPDGVPLPRCGRCGAFIPVEMAEETGGYCHDCAEAPRRREAAVPTAPPAVFEDRLVRFGQALVYWTLPLGWTTGLPAAMVGTALLARGDERGQGLIGSAIIACLISSAAWIGLFVVWSAIITR